MIIKKIKLQNFMSIEALDLSLTSPLVIVGANYSGKSSIIRAIRLSLFADTDDVLSSYIKWGASKAVIDLDFSHAGVDYHLVTSIQGSSSVRELTVFKDGVKASEMKGTSAMEYLNVQGVITPVLEACLVTRQFDSSIVTAKPAERLDLLGKLYDFSTDGAVKVVTDHIKATTDKVNDVAKNIGISEALISKSLQDITNLEQQKDALQENTRTQEIIQEINAWIEAFNTVVAGISVSDEVRQVNQGVAMDIEAPPVSLLDDKVRDVTEHVSIALTRSDNIYRTFQEVMKSFPIKIDALNNYRMQLKSVEDTKKDVSERSARIEKLKKDLAEIPERVIDTVLINSLRNKISQYRAEEQLYNKELHSLQTTGECVTCGQPMPNVQLKIVELNNKIDNLKINISKDASQLNSLDIEAQEASGDIQKRVTLQAILSSEEREYIQAEQRLKTTEGAYTSTGLIALENEVHILKLFNDIAQKVNNDTLNAKIRIEGLLNEYRKIGNVDEQKKAIDTKIEELNKYIDAEQVKVDEYNAEHILMSKRITNLEDAKVILHKKLPQFIISHACSALELLMNTILEQLTIDIKVTFELTKTGCEIKYSVAGSDFVSIKLCSGYEMQAMNLAYKLALLTICQGQNLILDEADSASSTENAELFYRVVSDRASIMRYIPIVITHKSEVAEMLTADYRYQQKVMGNGNE